MCLNFLRLLFVSLLAFMSKTIFQLILEWFNVFPLRYKVHVWNKFIISYRYICLDFLFHFWVYILISILMYFVLKSKNINKWVSSLFFVIIVLLFKYDLNIPFRVGSADGISNYNFELIQDFILYVLTIFLLSYFINKLVIPFGK